MNLLLSLILSFSLHGDAVLQQKTPYTDYMQENYPTSLEAITAYMKKKNPDAEEKRMTFLIEYQCKALETLLLAMNEEGADFKILYRSIEKITESTPSDRKSMDFWTWPSTDWAEVEYDYFFTIDTQ